MLALRLAVSMLYFWRPHSRPLSFRNIMKIITFRIVDSQKEAAPVSRRDRRAIGAGGESGEAGRGGSVLEIVCDAGHHAHVHQVGGGIVYRFDRELALCGGFDLADFRL